MEQVNKIRVALISGFTNKETRSHLKLKGNGGLFKLLIKFFGLPSRVGEHKDTTPWIENIIYNLEKRNDVELHIIGPQIRLRGIVQHFEIRNVHYYYYNTEFTSFLRLVKNYRIWKCFQTNGRRVKNIVENINPDIVVLSGTENPNTSQSVLYIDNYPQLILCQVVYGDPQRLDSGNYNKLIYCLEKEIFASQRYVGVYGKMHYDIIHPQFPKLNICKYQYPKKPAPIIEEKTKKYDFVNFAYELSESKGAQDSVRALAIVKQKYPNVTLNLAGGCSESVRNELNKLISDLDLKANVSFTPAYESRIDMFHHIKEARFAVLPIKLDIISGTVYQAMRYGLPVVTNKRPGTVAVNSENKSLLLADVNDYNMLAEHMLSLMSDKKLAFELYNNAIAYIKKKDDMPDNATDNLLALFRAVINNYHNGSAIPEELIYTE